jgi:hypothetical protein
MISNFLIGYGKIMLFDIPELICNKRFSIIIFLTKYAINIIKHNDLFMKYKILLQQGT